MKLNLPLAFTPKLFTTLKEGYSKEDFFKDLIAGVIVGPPVTGFDLGPGVEPSGGRLSVGLEAVSGATGSGNL